jgi:hypothetical protein
MTRRALLTYLAGAVCAFGAGTVFAQPAYLPAGVLRQPAAPASGHPYRSALGAVANYQSCGASGRRASSLDADLRANEAAARAKGLGPELDRIRREYQAMLAVSDMMACVHGPRGALADARRALAAFRAWVNAQPGLQ